MHFLLIFFFTQVFFVVVVVVILTDDGNAKNMADSDRVLTTSQVQGLNTSHVQHLLRFMAPLGCRKCYIPPFY